MGTLPNFFGRIGELLLHHPSSNNTGMYVPLQVSRCQERMYRCHGDAVKCTVRVGHRKTFAACHCHGEYPKSKQG